MLLLVDRAPAEEASFDSAGVKIHYQIEGSGPPVLLIHGYMASGHMNWRVPGVIAHLATDYKVITIDNRGHGKSDKPTSPEAYGSKMADDQVRLLDHLGIAKAHVVGYSMGGMITFNVCARYPERVTSAVVSGMGWIEKGPIAQPRERTQLPRPMSPNLRACAQAFPDLGITREQLQGITLPVTVIIGSADGLVDRRVKPMQAVRPDIPVVLIPEGTHVSCLFKPQFKTSIKDWLDKQPRP
jgi:pimeloyl-ACP methyl ester carboxylesterase